MARILWRPPGLLQGSTRSFTPTGAGHSVPTGVRCTPATTQGPFAPEALPSLIATTGPCACPVASRPLRHWSRRHCSSPLMPSTAGPPDRPSFDCVASSESVVPSTPGARSVYTVGFFPSDNGLRDGWLGALQVFPQATSRGRQLSTLQAFPSITTLSFTCPPGRSHAVSRGEGFVARACLGFVSSSQVEPVIRLNRPISGAGFAPASHRVLLAAPVGLGDIHPTHRLRSVRSSLQPFGKVLEIPLQLLTVVPPRLPVHA